MQESATRTHRFLTLSTTNGPAIRTFTPKQLLTLVINDNFIFTKRTLFQILQPSRLDFLSLLDALVERKEFCGEEAAELGLGEGEFAPGLVHAEDGGVM